jgi:hypothetical protein
MVSARHVDSCPLGHAVAVDNQALACHEVRGGRCEEQRGSTDFASCGDAPHRGEAGHGGDELGIAVFAELGAVEAGAEGVDLDAGLRLLESEFAREVDHGALRGGVAGFGCSQEGTVLDERSR